MHDTSYSYYYFIQVGIVVDIVAMDSIKSYEKFITKIGGYKVQVTAVYGFGTE